MLVLNDFSFEFGSRYLYKDTSWHIKPGQKIGLIGANGTGKSTLLRVIAGEYKLSSGTFTKRNDLTIGFLNQDLLSYESEAPILTVAMQAFARANQLHEEIEEILHKLEHDHSDETLHLLHDKQAEYESLDGYNLQYKAEAILEGLGFTTEQLQKPLNLFSGGWRMRVMLAKILLQQPSLLLLDEPTNHLDLPSIQWLEDYLESYSGTFVIVSHDRYFLDRIVTTIAEVANQQITLYTGNYEDYLEEKILREELQHNQFVNQEKYIKEQEKLIDRFRAKASKAKMAQSRIKMLDRIERVEDVNTTSKRMRLKFTVGQQPGRVIAELDVKRKSYPGLEILQDTTATIARGDKIALIGANGRGKSTLLRMLNSGEPFEGKLTPGYNVSIVMYAQHQLEALNINNNLLEELQHMAPTETDTYLRGVLGAFLFEGDDVFKKIKVLSGGEKSRVALAKAMLSKSNFLLLDEPTNHLDMLSVNVLIDMLQGFEGSFVVVSHDRHFISQIANKIWYIENKQIKEYPGTYQEYEDWTARNKAEQRKTAQQEKATAVAAAKAETKPATQNTNNTNDQNKKKKEYQKLQKTFAQLETDIANINSEKLRLEELLGNPEVYANPEQMKATTEKYQTTDQQLKEYTMRWEELFIALSDMEKEIQA